MDKKRLIGEEEHIITKGEIDAWHRGKDDAAANKLLIISQKVSVKQAIALVKMYAELGDIHYLSTRFDISLTEARRVLAAFGIHSIEDAKNSVRNGIIAEYHNAAAANREKDELNRTVEHQEAQQRLDVIEKEQEVKVKSIEEQDISLAERRDEAQRRNKEDSLRQLIAEGLDPDVNTSKFRIPLQLIARFKQMIPYGVSQIQRQFGGSAKDIVNEIKRLAPDIDIDMLRR